MKILEQLIIFLFPVLLLSCVPNEMELETARTDAVKILVNPEKVSLVEGRSFALTASVSPWNAAERTVIWSSSDESVVMVNEDGRITGVVPGEADVIASLGELSAVCHVTVRSSDIPAESVSISGMNTLSVRIGEEVTVNADIYPEDATVQPEWSSSDKEIFEVDSQTGILTAKSEGIAELIVKASDASASIPVLVHGSLWIEQTDALIKPVSFEEFDFTTDTIRVARGETATFQGIVYSEEAQGTVTPVVTRFAPDGQDGIAVEPEMYWLKDIRCPEYWEAWAGGRPSDAYPSNQIMFPDPQIPVSEETVILYANDKRPLWVEFTIPEDLPAGLYRGTVEISGGSGLSSRDFHVKVYDVTLPEKQYMDVIEWLDTEDISLMNNGQSVDMDANLDHFVPKIIELMNNYGQNCWQQMYFGYGYNMRDSYTISAEYNEEKDIYEMRYTFKDEYWEREFNMYDTYCKHLSQVHSTNIIAGRTEDGGLILPAYELGENGGVAVDENGKPKQTYVTYPTDDPVELEMGKMLLRDCFYQMQEYLRSHRLKDGRTWLDVYVLTLADEPDDKFLAAYNQVSQIIKEYAPDIKRLEPVLTNKIDPSVLDYPCPTLNEIHNYNVAENQTLWMYTCVQPQGDFANRFIRIPLFKTRLVHWVQYKYNAKGFLHWALNYWRRGINGDPWQGVDGRHTGGDSWMIWPGDDTVYPSIRLSAMRDGIRDYELLRMVEGKDPAKAQEICSRVVIDNGTYNLDLDNFRQVRKEMLEYLDSLY